MKGVSTIGCAPYRCAIYDAVYLFAQVMKEQGITGDASKVENERLAIRDGLKTVSFSGVWDQISVLQEQMPSCPAM